MENHHLHHQEMQFLPYPNYTPPNPSSQYDSPPSLDLQLSISLTPFKHPSSDVQSSNHVLIRRQMTNTSHNHDHVKIEALKWQAAEQIRLAAMEKAYAEHVMELTRREMELAQSEFARARALWARAMEEVERAEKIKERATHNRMDDDDDGEDNDHDDVVVDPTCMDITCFSCRQKFKPN